MSDKLNNSQSIDIPTDRRAARRSARKSARDARRADALDQARENRSVASKRSKQKAKPKTTVEKKASVADKRENRKKARLKRKAEKAYAKTFGANDASSGKNSSNSANIDGKTSDGAPRAALYKGKMGASQKKSTKLQDNAKKTPHISDIVSLKKSFRFPKKLTKPILTFGIVALVAVSLYGPAQQYYLQMRETDRLQAEYTAVVGRSDTLQSEINVLQTDEGVEDKAHTDLGYVKKGESTASVKGLELEKDETFSSNIAPGSIPAPETWYSPLLDVFFGYSD